MVTGAIGVVLLAGATPASGDPPASVSTYFASVADARLCLSPICGGIWAGRSNRGKTLCGDGAWQRRCYAADIDLRRTRVAKKKRAKLEQKIREGRALTRGWLVRGRVRGFPRLDTLVVTEAWAASSSQAPAQGTFYRLRDRNIECVATPCFTIHAAVLNSGRHLDVSEVDLNSTDATSAELGRAMQEIEKRGLIVAGTVETVPDAGPAGDGRRLVVTQFYIRAR